MPFKFILRSCYISSIVVCVCVCPVVNTLKEVSTAQDNFQGFEVSDHNGTFGISEPSH